MSEDEECKQLAADAAVSDGGDAQEPDAAGQQVQQADDLGERLP